MVSSVIVSTYNSPDALEAVLLALTEQGRSDFEVIVADDGSTGDTATMAECLRSRLDYPFKLVRQEHRGFRAARARNLAALQAAGDYLIFLDGDCLPFPDFIEAHARLAGTRDVPFREPDLPEPGLHRTRLAGRPRGDPMVQTRMGGGTPAGRRQPHFPLAPTPARTASFRETAPLAGGEDL
ncbi:MAG: glycosyltransferase [Gemmatimonadota bacterium]